MINVDITPLLEENSDEILNWVKENYNPDDVFDDDELGSWAQSMGYD